MASQKTTRAVYGAREAVCNWLVDGYGAGGAVVRRSAGRIRLPVGVRTIGGVSFSVAIPLHLDNLFMSTMSLLIHLGVDGFDSLVTSLMSLPLRGVVRGCGRKTTVVQVLGLWTLKRLELVSEYFARSPVDESNCFNRHIHGTVTLS